MVLSHRLLRAFAVASLCLCAALSCAPIEPASPPPRPVVSVPAPQPAPPLAPAPTPEGERPAVRAPDTPPPVATAPLATAPPARPPAGPAVTLLLPLDAPEFHPAAEALRQGFFAAMTAEGRTLEVVVRATDASAEHVLAAYDAAAEAGTRVIVGPMTRSAVTALVRSGRAAVPTLALNQPESGSPLPHALYIFGLSVESEARQSARQAWSDTMRTAGVVSTTAPIDRRSRDAFVDEWLLLGGRITDVIEQGPGGDSTQLHDTLDRNPPQFVFLAAGDERARLLRPFLGSQTPVYATSQVNTTDDPLKNLDLNGVRLAEMPWLVHPQDPVVARYPRPPDLERNTARFYALGIDAERIAAELLDGRREFEFDGVTGQISVFETGVVERRPVAAVFRDGRCVALD